MNPIRIRFIIGKLTEDEVDRLRDGMPVISKMILSPDDYQVFNYREGDTIEIETHHGNRLWTTIRNLEVLEDEMRVILIFTLTHGHQPANVG